jgi:BlaI family penicillinase repressor
MHFVTSCKSRGSSYEIGPTQPTRQGARRAVDNYYPRSRIGRVTRHHDFGPLELKILGLFAGDDALSAGDIQGRLRGDGDELAYTTVMTVMSRLAEKGALSRRRDGKRFVYKASRTTSKLKTGIVARLHRTLFAGTRLKPFAALLDEDDLSDDELRTLRKLVDAKLKERRS